MPFGLSNAEGRRDRACRTHRTTHLGRAVCPEQDGLASAVDQDHFDQQSLSDDVHPTADIEATDDLCGRGVRPIPDRRSRFWHHEPKWAQRCRLGCPLRSEPGRQLHEERRTELGLCVDVVVQQHPGALGPEPGDTPPSLSASQSLHLLDLPGRPHRATR